MIITANSFIDLKEKTKNKLIKKVEEKCKYIQSQQELIKNIKKKYPLIKVDKIFSNKCYLPINNKKYTPLYDSIVFDSYYHYDNVKDEDYDIFHFNLFFIEKFDNQEIKFISCRPKILIKYIEAYGYTNSQFCNEITYINSPKKIVSSFKVLPNIQNFSSKITLNLINKLNELHPYKINPKAKLPESVKKLLILS